MPGARDRGAGGRLVALCLLLAILALAAAFGFQKIRSFDYWWHLRTGALIAETGSVPVADPYTYTAHGRSWVDIHWLFQLGLHGVHRIGGHSAVVFAKVGMIWALVGTLGVIGWRRRRPAVTAFGILTLLLVAGDRFMPRPELLSFVLLAGVLALLERDERRGDAWVFCIVPLQIVWVNVHGLFALGVAACAIYAASELLRPVLTPGESIRFARVRRLAILTAAATLASLANPRVVDGALYPLAQLAMIGPAEDRGLFGSMIAELVPPLAGTLGAESFALLLAAFSALAALVAMALNWRRVSGAHPLLWTAFGYLGLGAKRNLALMAIVCTPILVRNLNEFLDRHPAPRGLRRIGAAAVLLAILAALVDVRAGSFFPRVGSMREPGLGVSEVYYPTGAVDWILRERPPGPICHHMADGGYLISKLYPDYAAMVDGRLEVFGPELFARLQVVGPEHFRELDREYHFGTVLVHYSLATSEALVRWLQLSSNWRLVFADEAALLYLRVPERGRMHWSEVDVDAPDLFPEMEQSPGPVDRARRIARTSFFSLMRRPAKALAAWESVMSRYPDRERGARTHAVLLAGAGRTGAAEAILRRLLRGDPGDATLIAQLGDLRLGEGDLPAARALYDQALGVAPRYVYAVLRRAHVAEGEGDLSVAAVHYAQVIAMSSPGHPHATAAAEGLLRIGGPAVDSLRERR